MLDSAVDGRLGQPGCRSLRAVAMSASKCMRLLARHQVMLNRAPVIVMAAPGGASG